MEMRYAGQDAHQPIHEFHICNDNKVIFKIRSKRYETAKLDAKAFMSRNSKRKLKKRTYIQDGVSMTYYR